MNHGLAAVVLSAVSIFSLAFQDPPAAAPKTEDGKEFLKKGLEASAAAGGFTFTGSVDQESPLAGAAMAIGGAPMFAVGPDGKCAGTLGADGVSHIKLEKDKNVYELFRKGSRIVHRQVWKGTQIASGGFASESAAALDLARLAKAVGKSKDVKKEEATRKVGDVECVVVRASLSSDIVEAEEAPAGAMGFDFKMFELKRVDATFWLGKDDNLVRKAEFKFVKGLNPMIAAGMPGGGGEDEEEDEEDDGGGMGGLKKTFSSTFKFTLGAFSKTTAVTVPDDVKGLLQD